MLLLDTTSTHYLFLGYIAECRKRSNMFTKEQIETIFINLEDILKFQTAFLKDLEACINWDAPYKSCVGACFLRHRAGKILMFNS